LAPSVVRFFLCGEYGDQTQRPHYHACLFGVGFEHWSTVATSWGKGFVHTGDFNQTTAQYAAGYVTKKMTSPDDPRLQGRHPEFARMSRRPGLGRDAMVVLSDQLHSEFGLDEVNFLQDVPHKLNIGHQSIPLGRYLRSALRVEMGFSDEMVSAVKARFFFEKSEEMRALWTDHQVSQASSPGQTPGASLKSVFVASNQARIWSIEGKSRIYNRRFL